jgi:iron complex outermembrane receptor protein
MLASGSSPAQVRPLKELSMEELGDIRVTTQTKEPEEIWQTPAAISVLTQDDIRRLGATNIPELLRMLPGVFVGTVNSSNWAVSVRGFTSNFSRSLLVLIDGRSVYTPLFGGVYWGVQDVVLEDIDRIEVIRGPGGTVWGENAVNGVINIITKPSLAPAAEKVPTGSSERAGSAVLRFTPTPWIRTSGTWYTADSEPIGISTRGMNWRCREIFTKAPIRASRLE